MPESPRHLRFGSHHLDTVARELRGADGVPVPLTGKAFDALVCLIANRERIVGKDELLATVWPGRVVEENNLTQAISALRRALGQDASEIVTVAGRGYRFAGELLPEPMRAASPADVPADDAPSTPPLPSAGASLTDSAAVRRPSTRALAWSAVALAALATAGLAWRLQAEHVGRAAALARQPVAPAAAAGRKAGVLPTDMAPTLAVLPFHSLSPGAADPLLELGLAETLIARTSDATGLRVRSLASSQRFANTRHDPLEAGRQLGADYVIEGTTQRDGARVRVNARLLSVRDGSALWSETFDETVDRAFTLQDAMASAVSTALALTLRPTAGRMRSPCDGADPVAYRAYLVGRYQLDRPSAARMREALAAFRRANDRDPTCARAYAGMAFAYRALVMTGDDDPREGFPRAQAAVSRALAIDPDLPEAHASQGFIHFWYDWDWARAEAALRRAIALNPSSAEARMAYAHLLNNLGRSEEASAQARQAAALDPLSPLVLTLSAAFIAKGGHPEEAARGVRKALEIEPDFWTALLVKSRTGLLAGKYEEEVSNLLRARELCGGCSQVQAVLGPAYVMAGDRASAERVLREMEMRDREAYVPATSMAAVRNALGDTEGALDLLERGYAQRDVRMAFLVSDWNWKNLYAHPRFRALARRMRLEIHDPAPPPTDAKPGDQRKS